MGLLVLNYVYTNEGMKEFFQIYFDFPQNEDCPARPIFTPLWTAEVPGNTHITDLQCTTLPLLSLNLPVSSYWLCSCFLDKSEGIWALFVAVAHYLILKGSKQLKYLNYYDSGSQNSAPKK